MHDSFHVVCVRVCVSAAKSHLDSISMPFYARMYTVAQIKHRRTETSAGRTKGHRGPQFAHPYATQRLDTLPIHQIYTQQTMHHIYTSKHTPHFHQQTIYRRVHGKHSTGYGRLGDFARINRGNARFGNNRQRRLKRL